MSWSFHEGELDRADVRALLAQHVAEMNAGSPPSACHVLAVDALADPAIRFFTVRVAEGTLLGCGALKRHRGRSWRDQVDAHGRCGARPRGRHGAARPPDRLGARAAE